MFKVEVVYYDAYGCKQTSKWGGDPDPLTHPGNVLCDVLAQMDPFMRPYDGDSVGTHGDPSDFHASLDRNFVLCAGPCQSVIAPNDWRECSVCHTYAVTYPGNHPPRAGW